MSDSRPPRFSDEPRGPREPRERPDPRPASSPLADLVEVAVRRIITAIVLAGALIGLAIWSQEGAAPRYQVTAADGRIIRVNTDSGTVIACEVDADGDEHCAIVLERGHRLERRLSPRALPAPAARPAPGALPAAPALPAPAPAAGNEAAAAPAGR